MSRRNLTPENLHDLFAALQAADFEAIVVGGQAVNLWAFKYLDTCPQLQAYLPFASEDLDFYGGKGVGYRLDSRLSFIPTFSTLRPTLKFTDTCKLREGFAFY